MNKKGQYLLIALVIALSVFGSSGGAIANESSSSARTVKAVPWSLVAISGAHTLTIRFNAGYCAGNPKPKVDRVRIKEHRRSAWITVFVGFPATDDDTCGGLRKRFSMPVKLEKPIGDRALFDGSTSPPRVRYG